MRILQIISSAGFYGAEAVVVDLSEALIRLGHELKIVAMRNSQNPNTELADRARSLGIPVEVVPCAGRLDLRTVRHLRQIRKRFTPNVVHAHGYKADLYALLSAARDRSAAVATCHNWTNSSPSLRGYAKIDRMALRRYDRVICVSPAVQEALLNAGVSPKRTAVVWNGVDVEKYARAVPTLTRRPGSFLIGMVGRLVPEKGFDLALKATPELLKRHPEARFVIAGEGPARAAFEALAHQLGIAERVVFLGARTDMPGVYRSLDLLVLPSWNEGMPMTVLEAMSAGVPVVSTRVGSIPVILVDRSTGLLIEPGNPAEIGKAIARCIGNPEERIAMGQAGQAWAFGNASIQNTAKTYVAHYEGVVKTGRFAYRDSIPG